MQSAKQQAASQRRSLRAAARKFTNMSRSWDGVDGYFESRLAELEQEVMKLDREMAEYIAEAGSNAE